MNEASILSADFKARPYWWEALARDPSRDEAAAAELPRAADVVIVGAGLTGVSAAWELVRAGRDVVALDAGEPGEGASSRNAGMLGRNFKHTFKGLIEAHGLDTARAYFSELHDIYKGAVARIDEEKIECDYRKCGRFIGALSPSHHQRLVEEYELRAKHLGEELTLVPVAEELEIGSTRYYGGVHIVDNASIQPARHYDALRRRAERAGARLIAHTPVSAVTREGNRFLVHTARGSISARDVLIATNGYTRQILPWFFKRLIPINAFMIATEPLSDNLAKSVLPAHRTYADNRRTANYMQLSPDGKRLLFGGRTGLRPPSLKQLAVDLHREMVFLFPQLEGVKIEYAWTGRCAASGDLFPHTGVHDGMHYSMGYCFSGNAMGPYLGMKAAKRILGSSDAGTIFERPLPGVLWPARQQRLIPLVMHYYRWMDRPVDKARAA
jgi:glycine/D-amino acid oxidase-like deaminating enzyme